MSTETHVTVINHCTRILRVNLPNVEGRAGLLKVVLMPGRSRVETNTWKKCLENPGVQAWMEPRSLRDRTGRKTDGVMVSTNRKLKTEGVPKVEATTSAKPLSFEAEEE